MGLYLNERANRIMNRNKNHIQQALPGARLNRFLLAPDTEVSRLVGTSLP